MILDDTEQEYFGKRLDLESCDALLMTRWQIKDRKRELRLFTTKWFDLRTLHPTRATYFFGHLFTKETRALIRAHINPIPPADKNGRVVDWEPIKAGDIFEPPSTKSVSRLKFWKAKITALIRARQNADELGIPYTFYIRAGLRAVFFGNFHMLNTVAIPCPTMLLQKHIIEKILMAWASEIESRIVCATSERFLIANAVSHLDIDAHQKWLCDQIARKSDPKPALRKYIASGFLSESVAVKRFGADRVSASRP